MSFFQSSKILPTPNPPMFPALQSQFGDWLLSEVGKGMPAYSGQINPSTASYDANAKMTGDPTGSANAISMLMGAAKPSPTLNPMAATGMAGGGSAPGGALTNFMNMGFNNNGIGSSLINAMNTGTTTGPGGQAGGPLTSWANISPQNIGMFLGPLMSGNTPGAYKSATIG